MFASIKRRSLPLLAGLLLTAAAQAASTAGTLVVLPAFGEVRQANDEAHLVFAVEEQDKDKTVVASRVNLKMKQGIESIKREDPQALLKTRGYYTYPVYADEPVQRGSVQRTRPVVGWRVGQYLDVATTNLAALPRTVATAQNLLSLNGLNFGLSEAATKRLDERRILATYQNLNERIAAVAKAMGRNATDALIETVDFEGSGAYAPPPEVAMAKMSMRAAGAEPAAVAEPSFEPGETTLQMRLVGKVRFQ